MNHYHRLPSDILFESVASKSYGKIEYSQSKLKELQKKQYKSNGYYWFYIGGDNYCEVPAHNYVWNLHHPNDRINLHARNLIHHKNENKLDNSPSNLIKQSIEDHNKAHLTQRRKDMPGKFNSKSSALGGKAAQKKHPELKNNLHKK